MNNYTKFHKYTLYIPTVRRHHFDVRSELDNLRWIAGGQSEHEITGSWVSDGRVVEERVRVVTYLFDTKSLHPAQSTAVQASFKRLTDALHALGEESVLFEHVEVDALFN